MRTKKTCCCCGNKRCKDNEFQYPSTSGTDCRICALGRTTSSVDDFEMGAPEEPIPNQGDNPSGWGDDEGDPNNLHMGDICWHRGPVDWAKYPSGECEWNDCWDDEEYGSWFSDAGANSEFSPPEVSFYQFQSPMGLLPWSPSVFKDWIDNWNGPLLPQGDCTMHCTEENIGCHTLAFVGAIGKNYGNTDNADSVPLCGSDIVTIPPPIEEWGWVREWVQNGGKLIIMGESSGSPVESMPSCRSKLSFFDVDSTYYVEHCEEDVKTPMVSMTGEEVANVLYDFAHFCAWQSDESEPELFFEFETLEPGSQNFINNFDDDTESEVSMSCCQRTKRPFLHRENDADKMQSFSFACSSSSGLIPKKKGEAIVGHCGGDGCTVVYKQNGMGAVIVVYDSNVWGGSSTQVPMEWWNQEANHPKNIKLGLSASELKERACNNDFWKFVCEDFLKDEEYHPHECDDANYWNHMSSDDWKMDENPCIKTAGCALPDGSCIETNVWDCFDQTSDDGRLTPGVWYGSEILHPSGMGGNACKSCGDINTPSFEEGVCCILAPDGCDNTGECCISEDWYGGDVMYQYECECIAHERGDVDKIKWIAGEYECDACFKVGACCTIIDDGNFVEECDDEVRQIVCEDEGGIFAGEDTSCDESPCSPLGACCLDDSTCVEQIMDLDCTNNEGTWAGADTTCEECDNIFACCFDDTTCENMLRSTCEEEEGQFLEGAMCEDGQCLEPTACCHGSNEGCQQCALLIPWICEIQLLGTPMYVNDNPCNCIGGFAEIEVEEGCDVDGFPEGCESVCVVDECHIEGPCCEQKPVGGCWCNVVIGLECITDTEAETLIKKVWNGALDQDPEFTCENNSCCGVCCNVDSDVQDDECGFIDEECGWTTTEDYCYENTTNSLWVSCTAGDDVELDPGLGDDCSCSCACTDNEDTCVDDYAGYEEDSYVNCGWYLNEMCCTDNDLEPCLDGIPRCECIRDYGGTPFTGRTCNDFDGMCETGVCCLTDSCFDDNGSGIRQVECLEMGGSFVDGADCTTPQVCVLGACCYRDYDLHDPSPDLENKCVMVPGEDACIEDYGGNFIPDGICPCTMESNTSPCNRGGACCVRILEGTSTNNFRGYCYMTDLETCQDSCEDFDEFNDYCNYCWNEYGRCDFVNVCAGCNVCNTPAADCPNDGGATWNWECGVGICTTNSMIGCRYNTSGASTGCNIDDCRFYTGSDTLDSGEYYCVSPARTTEDCQLFDCNEVRGCCIWCGNNPGDELNPNCAINDVTYPECLSLGHSETVWFPVKTCCT